MRLFIIFPFPIITREEKIIVILNSNFSIGKRIRAQRLSKGMTQEKLAEAMCVPKSTISAYENDHVDIKTSVILELSKILETTPNYLMGVEKDPCMEEIVLLIDQIKDKKVRDVILVQIRALVENQ